MLTIEEQGLQSVREMRDLLDKQKLQLSNQVRGLLLETNDKLTRKIATKKILKKVRPTFNSLIFALNI